MTLSSDKMNQKTSEYVHSFTALIVFAILLCCLSGMNISAMSVQAVSAFMGIFAGLAGLYCAVRLKGGYISFAALALALPMYLLCGFILDAAKDMRPDDSVYYSGMVFYVILYGGICVLAISLLALVLGHKLESVDGINFILVSGLLLKAVMAISTPFFLEQHDVWKFDGTYNYLNSDYIRYIFEHNSLPVGDVRTMDMYYHPPLHYVVSAIWLKLGCLLTGNPTPNYDTIKCLSLIYSAGCVHFTYKILKQFELKGKSLLIPLAFVSFIPQFIFGSSWINNDMLAVFLFFVSFYLMVKWLKEQKLSTAVLLAVSIGCSMMTKLSAGLVAIPVAVVFAVVFFKGLKESSKIKKLLVQFTVFALVVFPLGLWFPIRNLVMYGVPINYVRRISESIHQNVDMFSVFDRLFGIPGNGSASYPFLLYDVDKIDYNMFLALFKTAMFDQRDFGETFMLNIARVILALAFIVAILGLLSGVASYVHKLKSKTMDLQSVALLIMFVTLIASYIKFCFDYPVVCTMSFRYVAPLVIALCVWIGDGFGMDSKVRKQSVLNVTLNVLLAVSIVFFCISVFAFYGNISCYNYLWAYMAYAN